MELSLIDIDGVIADDEARVEFALAKDWTNYFDHARMMEDIPLSQGRELIQAELDKGNEVQYLTGRREDLRGVTTAWLVKNEFPLLPLHMRPLGKKIPLANLKGDFMRDIVLTEIYDHVVLFDDDPEVIRLVQEQLGMDSGVHCTWKVKRMAMVKEAIA